jgi:mono/diheme cytochrome c family protein
MAGTDGGTGIAALALQGDEAILREGDRRMATRRWHGTDTAGEFGQLFGWVLGGAVAALVVFAATAFGQDTSLAPAGKRLFNDQGCYGCHTIGKVGTPIAPDLSAVGSKYSQAYLRAWLMDPQKQKPTAHMPKLSMNEAEARSLAAYLASLR